MTSDACTCGPGNVHATADLNCPRHRPLGTIMTSDDVWQCIGEHGERVQADVWDNGLHAHIIIDTDTESGASVLLTVERARELARYLLRSLPFDARTGHAECSHYWQLTEDGYSRSWSTRVDDENRTVTAEYSGTEDWSDEGDGVMFLECLACQARKLVPDDYEIDYR